MWRESKTVCKKAATCARVRSYSCYSSASRLAKILSSLGYVYNHKQVYSTHYESEFMIKMLPLNDQNDMAHITQLA